MTNLLCLDRFEVESTAVEDGKLIITVRSKAPDLPRCCLLSELKRNGTKTVRFRDFPLQAQPVWLAVRRQRAKCPYCDTVLYEHATTRRVVNEAFAAERSALQTSPLAPYLAVLRLERRVSHEGMVCVGGNLYSVPDTTRCRVLDVHVLADAIRIFEDDMLIACHSVWKPAPEQPLPVAKLSQTPRSAPRRFPSVRANQQLAQRDLRTFKGEAGQFDALTSMLD